MAQDMALDSRIAQASAAEPLLSVRNLRVSFESPRGTLTAVDGVDFDVAPGEVLGIAGESGSGKSVTLRAILRLVKGHGHVAGETFWRGRNLLDASENEMRRIRGGEIGIIFQEPMTALNPVLTVGLQIRENLKAHTGLDSAGRRKRAIELLDLVGIPAAKSRLEDYPHQFSGGMRQRAMIAIALASNPKLLLADEPTTALDVTIQDQILKLILRLRSELNMSVVLVTHDLGVIAQTCDRLTVMYAGRVVENGPVAALFRRPRHAYTLGLLNSVPRADQVRQALASIPGQPPLLSDLPPGCAFAPRCRFVTDACTAARPPLVEIEPMHQSACIHHDQVAPAEP
jgi:peptide/nickel transport system ATP-binding protein/oligopeptide transport system ATP-binding protein